MQLQTTEEDLIEDDFEDGVDEYKPPEMVAEDQNDDGEEDDD